MMTISAKLKWYGPLLIILGIFIFILSGDYAMHNDYYRWGYNPHQGELYPETYVLFGEARPVGAILLNLEFFLIPATMGGFFGARIVSLGLLLLNGFIFYKILEIATNFSMDTRRWMSLAFILIPANILNTIWVSNMIPGHVAPLFGLLSFFVIRKDFKLLPGLLLSFLLFFLSLWTYPPGATIVYVLILASFLFPKNSPTGKLQQNPVFQIIFFTASIFLYMLVNKLLYIPLIYQMLPEVSSAMERQFATSGGHYEYSMMQLSDIWNKIQFLYKFVSYFFVELFPGIDPINEALRIVAIVLLFIGSLYKFLIRNPFQDIRSKEIIYKVSIVFVLMGLIFGPFLLPKNLKFELLGFRVTLAVSLTFIILIYALLQSKNKGAPFWFRSIPLSLLFLFSIASLRTGETLASNLRNEFQHVVQVARRIPNACSSPYWRIIPAEHPYVDAQLPLDLALNSTVGIHLRDFYKAVQAKLECGEYIPVDPVETIGNASFFESPGRVLKLGEGQEIIPLMIRYDSRRSITQPGSLFRRLNPNEFLEYRGKYPFTVEYRFGSPVLLEEYAISGFPETGKMPRHWKFQALDDDRWITLDDRSIPDWKGKRLEPIKLNSTKSYENYRIQFLSGESSSSIRIYNTLLFPERNQMFKISNGESRILAHFSTDCPKGPRGLGKALDRSSSIDSFWETADCHSADIKIATQSPVKITSYRVGSIEKALRMPTAWSLYGINDQGIRIKIDHRELKGNWGNFDIRDFEIQKPGFYKEYALAVEKSEDPKIFRLYEIQFYSNESWVYPANLMD